MQGWRIPRKTQAVSAAPHTTADRGYVVILPAFRKAGPTIHIINPADHLFLDKPRARLEAAGFGVMRGCVTWKQKEEPPWETLASLCRDLRTSAST
jgi:hypothetical protein